MASGYGESKSDSSSLLLDTRVKLDDDTFKNMLKYMSSDDLIVACHKDKKTMAMCDHFMSKTDKNYFINLLYKLSGEEIVKLANASIGFNNRLNKVIPPLKNSPLMKDKSIYYKANLGNMLKNMDGLDTKRLIQTGDIQGAISLLKRVKRAEPSLHADIFNSMGYEINVEEPEEGCRFIKEGVIIPYVLEKVYGDEVKLTKFLKTYLTNFIGMKCKAGEIPVINKPKDYNMYVVDLKNLVPTISRKKLNYADVDWMMYTNPTFIVHNISQTNSEFNSIYKDMIETYKNAKDSRSKLAYYKIKFFYAGFNNALDFESALLFSSSNSLSEMIHNLKIIREFDLDSAVQKMNSIGIYDSDDPEGRIDDVYELYTEDLRDILKQVYALGDMSE